MVKKLMLAVAAVALLAAPAFAAVQNVKVGGDIVTTSVIRDAFDTSVEGWDGFDNGNGHQNEILSQVRLNVGADLTDNVSTSVTLVNERTWGDQDVSLGSTSVGIQSAYVTLKEFLYSPLTLVIGRQALSYGNKLIIGSSTSNNNWSSSFSQPFGDLLYAGGFDAIKAILNYDPLTIDLFASRVDNGGTTWNLDPYSTHDNVNLFGINANYKLDDKMSTVIEGYVFAKVMDATEATYSESTYVPGLRVSTNPIEGLNVQLEGAYQLGRTDYDGDNGRDGYNQNRNAWAFQGGINYALPVLKDMKPVLGAQYTYLSGCSYDAYSSGKIWDPMFENQDTGRIFDVILPNSGIQKASLALEVAPLKDITAKTSLTGIWDVEKVTSHASKYEGSELDLDLTYAYTEDVKFGMSAGYFMPGKAAKANGLVDNSNKNASQLLSSVAVAF